MPSIVTVTVAGRVLAELRPPRGVGDFIRFGTVGAIWKILDIGIGVGDAFPVMLEPVDPHDVPVTEPVPVIPLPQ